MFDNRKDAKAAGWFSRRHESPDAHMKVRRLRRDRIEERRRDAITRQEARAERSDAEQLEVLRKRGVTEGREVDRLKARLEKESL